MFPTSATLFSLNPTSILKSKGFKDGPVCRQSFWEVPFLPTLAEAS